MLVARYIKVLHTAISASTFDFNISEGGGLINWMRLVCVQSLIIEGLVYVAKTT